MKAKSNKGKMPAGAPKGMNPMEFFRKGGEQRKAMFKKGGYNTPTQNPLPKRFMGGDDPIPPSQGGNSGMILNPYGIKKPNYPTVTMGNPFVRPNPLTNSLSYKPPVTRPTTTSSVVPAPTPVSVTPASTVNSVPAAPVLSAKDRIASAKADAKIAKIEAKANRKAARANAIAKEYETGTRKVKTVDDRIDQGMKVVELGLDVYDKVKEAKDNRNSGGGSQGPFKRGGSMKPKASKGMIVKSKRK